MRFLNSARLVTPDDLICSVLRNERPPWPWAAEDHGAAEAFRRQASLHGVEAMLHAHVHLMGWPASVLKDLRNTAVRQAMWELRHQQLLTQALAALHNSGIEPVLIKGTALAYSLYANPVLRTRGDTDLIVAAHDKQRAHEILLALGYQRNLGMTGEFVSYQASYTCLTNGDAHALDLHWKINNSELLSRLFTYDELRRDAAPLPGLCAHALSACPAHALLLACMHRSTHKQNPYFVDGEAHHTADRLIWLYDVLLLARNLSSSDWESFLRLATQKGLRAVCADGMQRTRACLSSEFPAAVLGALAQGERAEPAGVYLEAGKRRQQWLDFVALGSTANRLGFLRELLFPPPAYMHGKYPQPWLAWLPWLYLRRATTALVKGSSADRS